MVDPALCERYPTPETALLELGNLVELASGRLAWRVWTPAGKLAVDGASSDALAIWVANFLVGGVALAEHHDQPWPAHE